jgi:hypothetical protein
MKQEKQKKKFADTGFGRFIKNAGKAIPELAGAAFNIMQGDFKEAVEDVGNILKKKAETDEKAKAFLAQYELQKMDYLTELYTLEMEDRKSAREREIELAKVGKMDWMMKVVGMVGLLAFLFMLGALVFLQIPEDNRDIFIHAVGMVEGVIVSIFGYYYGSSRSSAEKTKLLSTSQG